MRLLLCLLAATAAAPAQDRLSSELPPGKYRLERPLRVTADNAVLDLTGVELIGQNGDGDPDTFTGIGIHVVDVKGLRIKGGTVRGFRCGILLERCQDVVIEGVDVSRNFAQRLRSTPQREEQTDWLWPHKNDEQQWRKSYGAGICLEQCTKVRIAKCTGRRMQNGLILDRCTKCAVTNCDFSFNSGWGVALWRSSANRIENNKMDFCVRGYSHDVYDRGQDSAGILVFEQCHHNVFRDNSATHGGDGFFLYAGNETLHKSGKGGCNLNVVADNDFRFAVANAIEATFSTGNQFVGNRCSGSNYGIWAGYSYECKFERNICHDNRYAGIAIEHGQNHKILGNDFHRNPRAIWLWWDDDKELLASAFGKARDRCPSNGYVIARNRFDNDKIAVYLQDTTGVVEEPNLYIDVGRKIVTAGASKVGPPPKGKLEPRPRTKSLETPFAGREHIRIGEWGPLPPGETAVFPSRVVAWERCVFHVLGGEKFQVEGLPETVAVERDVGRFRIVGRAQGAATFRGLVRVGDKKFPISGTVLRATWRVRHWMWTEDPRKKQKAWRRMLDTAPLVDKELPRLHFNWKNGGPRKMGPNDRFATRAEATIRLPAGRYEIRTLSDDGVRVWIDDKLVQEDWTWHAPKENKTQVELAGGVHRFVVEHFEIDGYAVLHFDLQPVSSR